MSRRRRYISFRLVAVHEWRVLEIPSISNRWLRLRGCPVWVSERRKLEVGVYSFSSYFVFQGIFRRSHLRQEQHWQQLVSKLSWGFSFLVAAPVVFAEPFLTPFRYWIRAYTFSSGILWTTQLSNDSREDEKRGGGTKPTVKYTKRSVTFCYGSLGTNHWPKRKKRRYFLVGIQEREKGADLESERKSQSS